MTRRSRTLHLYEEVMLLALRNDRGTVAGGVMYTQAAGGAILAELMLEGRVRTETKGRSIYAVVKDSTRTDDPILDECLKKMNTAKRRGTLVTWVQKFAATKQLRHRVASGLVDRGVLRESEDKVLLFFTRRIYPELDTAFEARIIDRLDRAIFSDTGTVDPRTAVLVALAHPSGLLRANFDRKRLKSRGRRIEAIMQGEAVGKATKQAIEAVQAAVVVAAIMPAIIVSTT
jgi:hypothetical protein